MVKMRLTIVCEYVANPEHYGTEDPVEMAKIDMKNFSENPDLLSEMIITDEYTAIVEPVKGED